ncbi:MAG: adenylyl-sulfate kinase [Planctomycetota bacterium]|jgi:adenylylsulfate kinase
MVIWLLGISGSGKTTLGMGLKRHLEALGKPCYMIDGDLVRGFHDNDLGYSREDRVANIKRILLSAHVLEQAGVAAIVCNISPFEELREFARRKIDGYSEIYLKKSLEASKATDVKGMYNEHFGKTDIVGIDIEFDEPGGSHLIINVDAETEEESLRRIIEFVQERHREEFR